jgi:hypothetical protein
MKSSDHEIFWSFSFQSVSDDVTYFLNQFLISRDFDQTRWLDKERCLARTEELMFSIWAPFSNLKKNKNLKTITNSTIHTLATVTLFYFTV